MFQASKGHRTTLEILLGAGAKIDVQDITGSTPLHRAASVGKLPIVRTLVEKGKARLEIGDGEGQTALHVAVSCKNLDCATFLAAIGGNLNVSFRFHARTTQV